MLNSKYGRPEVKIITKQWVKENCLNITPRDMGLLKLLVSNKRRLLRRDQIEILYPEFASTDRLNKRLKALYKMHVIDKIYPQVGLGKGSSKQYICLDRAGIILMGLEKYNKPIQVGSDGNKSLPLGWEHKVMINEYECKLVQFCNENGIHIKMYEVEQEHIFGNSTKLIPDILCVLVSNNRGYVFFIEVDMGTEDIPYIKSKIDLYEQYYISRSWISKDWAKMFKTPAFPRVILSTENNRPKRLESLETYSKNNIVRYVFSSHETIIDSIKQIIKG